MSQERDQLSLPTALAGRFFVGSVFDYMLIDGALSLKESDTNREIVDSVSTAPA